MDPDVAGRADFFLQRAPGHFQWRRVNRPATELDAQGTDHLRFARIRHHGKLRVTGGADEKHSERPFGGFLDFFKTHIGFAVQADEFHNGLTRES